ELLCLLDITAQILLTMNNQEWRVHILHIANWRMLHISLKVLPWRRLHFVIGKDPTHVAGTKIGCQISYGTISDRSLEAIRMPNQPVGHKAAIAPTRNAHTLLINVAFLQQGIHTGQNVQRVL